MSRNEPEKSYWDLLMKESRELHNFPLTPQKYIRNAIKTTLERVGVALTNDTSASTWFTLVSVEMHDADKSRNIPSEPSR